MDSPASINTGVKPGYKTTEFWLTAAATLMGLVLSSGAIGAGSTAERVAGTVCAMLSALGYSVSRGQTKK